MKTKPRLAILMAVLFASAPLLSAGEVERLRALVAEQEMKIQQLELKIAQLSTAPAPASVPPTPVSTASTPAPAPEKAPTPVAEEGLVATAETSPEPSSSENPTTYTVQAGDNMVKIARKHGTTSAILNELNGLKKDDIIRPGQKLKLPAGPSTTATAATTTPEEAPAPVAKVVEEEAVAPSTVKHTVASGETFYSIAKKHNVTTNALVKQNPSINPNALRVGQVVQIPNQPNTTNLTPVPGPDQTAALTGYNNIPVSSQTTTTTQSRAADKPIKITEEISYSDFAKQYNTTTSRLDKLNGLRLDPATILAKGSELYVPEQQ